MSSITSQGWGAMPVQPRTRAWLVTAALIAAIVAGYARLLTEFFTSLWAREYYQHFPFVLAAFGWLLVQRVKSGGDPVPHSRSKLMAAAILAAVAWIALVLAYRGPSPWLAYFSLIILTAAVILALKSSRRLPGVWPVWALLWVILPLPFNRDQAVITWLQRWSSRASSFLLDAAGVLHVMEGNALRLPEKELFVDETCSGIVSVMSIIACAIIYGVWRRRSAVHIVALATAGVGWATLMNTVRISLIAFVHERWNIDWSGGTSHEVLSLCVFLVTFAALISTDVLLAGLLDRIGPTWDALHSQPLKWGGSLMRSWDRFIGRSPQPLGESDRTESPAVVHSRPAIGLGRVPTSLAIGLMIAFLALPIWQATREASGRTFGEWLSQDKVQECINRALASNKATLPTEVDAIRFVQFTPHERSREDLMGNFSRSYQYRDENGRDYVVSCDFPYESGWHELTVCYQGVGWTLDGRSVRSDEGDGAHGWQRMEATFSKPDGARAFLTVCAFDERGAPIDLPTMSLWEESLNALRGRDNYRHQVAFQVQVWTTSAKPIDAAERQTARKLLMLARERFRSLIAPPDAAGQHRERPGGRPVRQHSAEARSSE